MATGQKRGNGETAEDTIVPHGHILGYPVNIASLPCKKNSVRRPDNRRYGAETQKGPPRWVALLTVLVPLTNIEPAFQPVHEWR
jgi:hypothetical protein